MMVGWELVTVVILGIMAQAFLLLPGMMRHMSQKISLVLEGTTLVMETCILTLRYVILAAQTYIYGHPIFHFVYLVFLFLIYTSRYVQNIEHGSRVNVLSHHLSLPKSTSHVAGVEKFFQYPDSVPCKIRAKRGCATHPRSIAERVSFFFSLLKCMLNMGVLVCIKQIEVIISPLLDMREIN